MATDHCALCEAKLRLTEDDWQIVKFWELVRDEYVNQGETKTDVILTPSLVGYAAALEVYGYPRALWPWLTTGAMTLHRLVKGLETVSWQEETGKPRYLIRAEDLTDAD
jgi:hypothetical protein